VFKFSTDTNMLVSSANNTIFDPIIYKGRSFMYNKNNIGPKIESCGTPCANSLVVQTYVPSFMQFLSTHCFHCDT
jgi:hypothetical protein